MPGKAATSAPSSADNLDVLLTRDLPLTEPADRWDFYAYAVDRGHNPTLARAFCRWLARLCRRMADEEVASDTT